MRIIGMTDFVLNSKSELHYFKATQNYANFLKQPLELWMFIACDEDNNVLKIPKFPHLGSENQDEYINYYNSKLKQYQQAKERCLFDGFEYCESQSMGIDLRLNLFISPYSKNRIYLTKKEKTGFHSWFELYTIENLVQCELTLTKTAEKLIGL